MQNYGNAREHGETALFPPSPRVFYEKAPLIDVIAQLRFPPILAIQAGPPAEFQERIRKVFPLVEEGFALGLPMGVELPAQVEKLISSQSGDKLYQFLSEDRKDTITLSKDMIGFSTKKYSRWEEFKTTLMNSVEALNQIYSPSFYNRIGLRYIDAINCDSIGLGNSKWSELFKREILGEISIPLFEENLLLVSRQIVISFPDKFGALLLQHGLGNIQNKRGFSYIIDFDFYREQKTEVGDASAVLERFHDLAGRAFRWCITDKLHNALGPRNIY
jgi:uncharacterized protein (TIGR04255 family)